MLAQPCYPRIYLPPLQPLAWPGPGWVATFGPPGGCRRPSLRIRPLGYDRPGTANQEILT